MQAPNEKEIESFDDFISRIDQFSDHVREGKEIKKPVMNNSFINYILPAFSRTKARADMGINM